MGRGALSLRLPLVSVGPVTEAAIAKALKSVEADEDDIQDRHLGRLGKNGAGNCRSSSRRLPDGRGHFGAIRCGRIFTATSVRRRIPVRTLEEPAREPVHVWIDFSRPAGTVALLNNIDCPIVIGTTGFAETDLTHVRAYSERHPVLLAPNTSPGMNLMMGFLEQLPPSANLGYDVVLAEEHHHHKKDAPSGTAKALLSILEAGGNKPVSVLVTRAGGIRGTHTVKLVSEDEEIVIEHRVMDRSLFARGALLGAHFLMRKKQPGLYSMKDVFKKSQS